MEYGIKRLDGNKAETLMAFLRTQGCRADVFESVSNPGHFSLTRVEPGEEDQVRFSDVYGPTEEEALEKMADSYVKHGVAINGFNLARVIRFPKKGIEK